MDDREPPRSSDGFALERLDVVEPIRFQDVPIPPRRWLLQDWIPLGAVTALYGDGGTGKSLLAQQLMTSCAASQPFLGHEVMRCKVLGVFCEDDRDELHRRQDAINAAMNIDFADLEDVYWLPRVGFDNLLMTFNADGRGVPSPFFAQIVKLAKERGAQLVVVDTAADVFAGNENIRPQVRQFIALLTRMAREIGGAVLLLAHPSQTGKKDGSGDGGSTAWSNSVRSRLYLKRPDAAGGNTDSDTRVLSRMKANYAQAGVEITVRYQRGAFVLEGSPETGGDGLYRGKAAEQAFMAGMNLLKEKNIRCNVHKGQANFAPKVLREKTTVAGAYSEDELEAAMNRLIRDNRIQSVEEGPASRRRSYLVVSAPDLPGVARDAAR
jgi:RecA-family ATPase